MDISRSGRIRKKSSKLADFESPDEIDAVEKVKKPKTVSVHELHAVILIILNVCNFHVFNFRVLKVAVWGLLHICLIRFLPINLWRTEVQKRMTKILK